MHIGRIRQILPRRRYVDFFERKGKRRLKADYHAHGWYQDFLDFVARERIFATMCTPAGYGAADARWDTWRVCEFAEILGFYGLQYDLVINGDVKGATNAFGRLIEHHRERVEALLPGTLSA